MKFFYYFLKNLKIIFRRNFKFILIILFLLFIFFLIFGFSISSAYTSLDVLPNYGVGQAWYSPSTDEFIINPNSFIYTDSLGGNTETIKLPSSVTSRKFIVLIDKINNVDGNTNSAYVLLSDSDFRISGNLYNSCDFVGSNIGLLTYKFRRFNKTDFVNYINSNIDSVEYSDKQTISLRTGYPFSAASSSDTSSAGYNWDNTSSFKPSLIITNFDVYPVGVDYPIIKSSYGTLRMPELDIDSKEKFEQFTQNRNPVLTMNMGDNIGQIPSYISISYQLPESLPQTKDIKLYNFFYSSFPEISSNAPIAPAIITNDGIVSSRTLKSYLGSSVYNSLVDGTKIKIEYYYYYMVSDKLFSFEYIIGDDSSAVYTDSQGNIRTPDNPVPPEPEQPPEEEDPNSELLGKQDEIISQQKELNETSKGIWDTLKDVLSYINPFSENFFVYKLIELLIDGLKSLFIPQDGFFDTFFSDLKNWFEERLGFLFYPFDLIIDVLSRMINLDFTEPVFKIPNINEPFTNTKLISATDYNLNSLLDNSTFKYIHDIYLIFVDSIIIFGLVNLAKNKFDEVTNK